MHLITANVSPGWLSGAFSDLSQGQRFALLLIGLGCLTATIIALTALLSGMWQSMHRSRLEADIKREMLDRGMSADEIAQVVEASTPRDFLERWAANKGRKKSA